MEHLKELKELLRAFDESKSTYLSYENGDLEITLKKEYAVRTAEEESPGAVPVRPSAPVREVSREEAKPERETTVGIEVKSPIVGVFYAAKEPGAAPFVKAGDTVKEGQVLCILESMKMMNEIKSPTDAKVVKILCENEAVVAFGEVLFVLEEIHA